MSTGILFSPETRPYHIQELASVHSSLPRHDFLMLYKDVNFLHISTKEGMCNVKGFENIAREFLQILGEKSGTVNLFCVGNLKFSERNYHVDPKNVTSLSV